MSKATKVNPTFICLAEPLKQADAIMKLRGKRYHCERFVTNEGTELCTFFNDGMIKVKCLSKEALAQFEERDWEISKYKYATSCLTYNSRKEIMEATDKWQQFRDLMITYQKDRFNIVGIPYPNQGHIKFVPAWHPEPLAGWNLHLNDNFKLYIRYSNKNEKPCIVNFDAFSAVLRAAYHEKENAINFIFDDHHQRLLFNTLDEHVKSAVHFQWSDDDYSDIGAVKDATKPTTYL